MNNLLFEDFSTPNIARCFAGIGSLGNNLIYNHLLEPIDGKKFDITLAFGETKTQGNPVKGNHKIICQSMNLRSPAKRGILLTMIEKDLDKHGTLHAGCYPASMKAQEAGQNPEELWSDRILDAPEIKLFNPDNENLNMKCGIEDFDELVSQAMTILDDDISNYVGYYVDVEYPLWLTTERFYFDFRR